MATLKSYLTSLEPDMSQSIYSQSIGGYCSNSLLYPLTTLSVTVGLYDTSISLETPSSGSWSEWQGIEYINIGNEMIRVSPMVNGVVTVVQRGYNGIINMHISGDEVWASSSNELFNDVFNDSYKQYRCIAIKNDSTLLSDPSGLITTYDFGVYLKQNSRNDNSSIKISLEQPRSRYISSASTSWTTMQIVDTTLIGLYEDNYFRVLILGQGHLLFIVLFLLLMTMIRMYHMKFCLLLHRGLKQGSSLLVPEVPIWYRSPRRKGKSNSYHGM